MPSTRQLAWLAAALCATLSSARPSPQLSAASSAAPSSSSQTSAVPSSALAPSPHALAAASSSSYWLANVDHSLDTVWQNGDAGYKVFRNVVTDYGAAGDGVTDDTAAINRAMSDGGRCGGGPGVCDSSTTTPAIVYFPPGTYLVSKPIQMYYYTQMIGDATNLPTILASPTFAGMALIDSDPYADTGANWYTNQNNFFRQVRNFIIDLRPSAGGASGAGIHWQVAQATSLQNIVFQMSTSPTTTQIGIFMDNGSGGYFGNLTFNGGQYGAFLGSQQFTTRDMTFNGCRTAIFMNWNWGWTIHGITVNGNGVPGAAALDMSNSPANQTVGSVVLADSTISGVEYGVRFAYQNAAGANVPANGGTLILDNVDMQVANAVVDHTNTTVLHGPAVIANWASGNGYVGGAAGRREGAVANPPAKAASLLATGTSRIFTRTRPQYETLPASAFYGAKANGHCAGDGTTNDRACVQNFLWHVGNNSDTLVAYFEHGAYLVDDTIQVPKNIRITGSIWSLIVATGAAFGDPTHPRPVFQVGQPGDTGGAVEISDIIFEAAGPAPGAIMVEWNLDSPQGASGLWDSHVRIGGTAGTEQLYSQCAKAPGSTAAPDPACLGVFLMFHATPSSGGVYVENSWFWVADHDLDQNKTAQISVYSARGALIQSRAGPVWLWGTASEHSAIYNYQFDGVQALFAGFMQSETPYYQPNPPVPAPFTFNETWNDPTFAICPASSTVPCRAAWGLRILSSSNVIVHGAGLYSFFRDYDQTCVAGENCQQHMIRVQGTTNLAMYAVSTKAAVDMIDDDRWADRPVLDADNRSNFCATLGWYLDGA